MSNILPTNGFEDDLRWRIRNRTLPIDEEGLSNLYVRVSYLNLSIFLIFCLFFFNEERLEKQDALRAAQIAAILMPQISNFFWQK